MYSRDINQQAAPAGDFSYGGVNWEWLTTTPYEITTGTLKVQLTDDSVYSSSYYVVADGAYISKTPSIVSNTSSFYDVVFSGGTYLNADELNAANDLTVNGGTLVLDAALDVDGDLAISSGALDVSADNHGIEVGGAWNNTGGTFTPNSGTVTFDGTSGSHQLQSGGQAFYDLAITGNGGTWTLQDSLAVTNDYAQTNGTLDVNPAGDHTVTVYGDFTQSGGTFTARNGTVNLAGMADQSFSAASDLNNVTVGDGSMAWKFDLGTGATEPGYTGVDGGTLYAAGLGYGWDVAVSNKTGMGGENAIYEDSNWGGSDDLFRVDIDPNTDYQITLYFRDNTTNRDVDVWIEGVQQLDDLFIPANTDVCTTVTVTAAAQTSGDGILDIQIDDGALADGFGRSTESTSTRSKP